LISIALVLREFVYVMIGLMHNHTVTPMRKRFAFATAILFAVAIIVVTSTFISVILTPTAVAAQQQQQINSNTSSSQSTNSSPNPPTLIAEILLGTTLEISSPLLFYVWKKERQDILMDLKKNEILQINSSIIVDVLIPLTLGYTLEHLHKTTISLITAILVVGCPPMCGRTTTN
jgi:hypothetical protein